MLHGQDSWENKLFRPFGGRCYRVAEIIMGYNFRVEGRFEQPIEPGLVRVFNATNVDDVLAFLLDNDLSEVRISVLVPVFGEHPSLVNVSEIVSARDRDGCHFNCFKGADDRIYTTPHSPDPRSTLVSQTRVWPFEKS